MYRRVLVAAFLVTAVALSLAADDAERWWAHVSYLADDKLEGRNTGSEGHRRAALYVAEHYEKAGLKPGGTNGFFQSVGFQSRRILEEKSSLALVRDGKTEPIVFGDEATFNMRIDQAPSLEAPLVFAGYGLVVPELGHDDLAGVDARGKVVVHLTGGPSSVPGPLLAHYQQAGERWTFLKRAGALGTIAIQNPRGQDIPWERAVLSRFQPAMVLDDPALQDTAGQKLAVTFNAARADKLLAGTGQTIKALLAQADAGQKLPSFSIPASVKATASVELTKVASDNVAGILPGTDAKLKDEYVVLSAHLDHVGVGRPINGDSIYNGAMDNASGIATLLEAAAMARDQKKAFKRSVIFLAVTAEEKGLLGSRYYALNPTVKRSGIVANVNMDMFLPLFPLKSLIVQGLEESDLAADIRRVGTALGVDVLSDPEPERRAFVRSDQYSFIRAGVPALSLKVGFKLGTPEHEMVKRWRTERYHAPSDDPQQPVDRGAAALFNAVLLRLAESVANRPDRPRWNPDSFFRRFATTN